MVDGAVARALRSESRFGEKLDSAVDLIFDAVCAVKLLPQMDIPVWVWAWAGGIAAVRVVNLVCACVRRRGKFIMHTAANKLTELLLFLMPLTAQVIDLRLSAAVACAAATFAVVQELYFIIAEKGKSKMKKYHIAKPTPEQLAWQNMELGVIIHYCMEIYNPEFKGYKTAAVRTEIPPKRIDPQRLDVGQWIRSAAEMGAKYAVLVANHCTGFSLWQTDENDYCTRSLKWEDGKGDICRDFIDECKKYGIKPGFYYSTGCNGYYDIDDSKPQDYFSPKYREYVKHVEAQVTELWTRYGELAEIWFDGGIIPVEKGGPDIFPLVEKYQPQAVCFQGPKEFRSNLRWVGNEDGLAPENCWATTNADGVGYDGTVPNEAVGVGDPNGVYYQPTETDTPNRSVDSFGGGWAWRAGEESKVRSPLELLDCYIRSVGRNSNLLVGMAISTDGDFQDEEQFREFGRLIKDTFSVPLAVSSAANAALRAPEGRAAKYLVIREDIADGQCIREFTVSADGKEIYRSNCVGHKRIIPLADLGCGGTEEFTFAVTESVGEAKLRDIAIY